MPYDNSISLSAFLISDSRFTDTNIDLRHIAVIVSRVAARQSLSVENILIQISPNRINAFDQFKQIKGSEVLEN